MFYVYSIDFVGDENFVAGSSYEAIDVGTIAGEITMYVKTRPDTPDVKTEANNIDAAAEGVVKCWTGSN